MKKLSVAVFFLMFELLAQAGDKWNDALSSSSASIPDSLALHNNENLIPTGHQVLSVDGATGRAIIIKHLNEIRSTQLMVNTITLEPYWQGVFASAGHPELYVSSQKDIQLALEAGLSPYLRGESINAEQFADAALAALEKAPAPAH